MSQPSNEQLTTITTTAATTTTTTTITINDNNNNNSETAPLNPKRYTAKAQTFDFFRFLLSGIVLAVLLGLVPALTQTLIFLQPRIPEFNVDSSTLSILNASSNPVVTNWNLTISVQNPDRKFIFYDQITGFALKGNADQTLSNITLPSFRHPGKKLETFLAVFRDLSFPANNCSGYDNSRGSSSTPCGDVDLRMELQARAKYGGWTWPVKRDWIQVTCKDVKVGFPTNVTRFVFGPSGCDITGHWKRLTSHCNRIFWGYIYVLLIIAFVLSVSL